MSAFAPSNGFAPSVRPGQEAAPSRSYPAIARVLHWLTAAMIGAQILSGVMMKQLGGGELADFVFTLHKTSGFLILVLVVARLSLRGVMVLTGGWRRYAPMLPVHRVLYAAIVIIPLLGWAGISDYGARAIFFGLSLPAIWPEGAGFDQFFFEAHTYLAFALLGLIAVHIGVAIGLHMKRGSAGEGPGDSTLS